MKPRYLHECDHCDYICGNIDNGYVRPCSHLPVEKVWFAQHRAQVKAQRVKAAREYNEKVEAIPNTFKRLWIAWLRDNPDVNKEIQYAGLLGGFVLSEWLKDGKSAWDSVGKSDTLPFWVPYGYSGLDEVTE